MRSVSAGNCLAYHKALHLADYSDHIFVRSSSPRTGSEHVASSFQRETSGVLLTTRGATGLLGLGAESGSGIQHKGLDCISSKHSH